ncbi:glycoside hydrolase family 72 protein [Teratosphaeria destructans]|uniref:1,3-beta-glucanosyltransferase n=1 Tax=Teratosphaeria destructans TaxID=418781 RepID=A0A9W7SS94_9PEZI|nr:glycoside hydrolase family 72 protein [Teratosphaeria destructans]
MAPLTSIFTSLCAFAATVAAVNPIEVHQQEFVDSVTNERFVLLGVDYQPGGQGAYGTNSGDPLSNATACLRDAALMQELGVNTIRCYNVDPTLNHDECVSIFNEVGIYMVIDVNSPLSGQSLDRSNPSGSYTIGYLQHIFTVVEAFKNYPNTLGFFAGNEIINDEGTGKANPPYIRAVQRDLKNYIAAQSKRQIPVGYSAADVADVLEDTWAYLQCNNSVNNDPNSRSDFFGLNSYSWCGNASSFTISGYDVLVQTFGNTSIPVFFSEYGCNKPQPRYFDEVPVLYGPQMTVLSGGLIYEWTQETSDYGLVQVYSNATAQLLVDYDTLAAQYNKVNISLIETRNDTATSITAPNCNSNLIQNSGFSTDFDIPSPPNGADDLISSGVSPAQVGKIVSVTQTTVEVAVYAANGAKLENLKITSASGANHPGAVTGLSTGAAPSSSATGTGTASHSGTGTGTASATASGATATKSSAAAAFRMDVQVAGSAIAAAALGAVAFAL